MVRSFYEMVRFRGQGRRCGMSWLVFDVGWAFVPDYEETIRHSSRAREGPVGGEPLISQQTGWKGQHGGLWRNGLSSDVLAPAIRLRPWGRQGNPARLAENGRQPGGWTPNAGSRKPPQSDYNASTRRVDWEAIASTELVQSYPKASIKLLQSSCKATPRLPQGFHRATIGRVPGVPKAYPRLPTYTLRIPYVYPRLPYGYPKAPAKPPSCASQALYKLFAWDSVAIHVRLTCVHHARHMLRIGVLHVWYMRRESVHRAWS